MNPLVRLLERAVGAGNRAALWRGQCQVWSQAMTGPTFERWLYLQLHRLGRMGGAERATLARIVRPGMTVLDIGSNVGLYTVLLSRLVGPAGRVISFEPDPDLFASLQRNCMLNACSNVEPHNVAVGREPGRLWLQKLVFNTGDNHLGGQTGLPFRDAVETEVVALDGFLRDVHPDLVKIDVQGWEFEALQGMQALMSAHPAADIYFELWPQGLIRAGSRAEDLLRWLQERGYRLHRPDDDKTLDAPALTALIRSLPRLQHADLIATHRP